MKLPFLPRQHPDEMAISYLLRLCTVNGEKSIEHTLFRLSGSHFSDSKIYNHPHGHSRLIGEMKPGVLSNEYILVHAYDFLKSFSISRICPECLKADEYIRCTHQHYPIISCSIHHCHLISKCPSCHDPLSYKRRSLYFCGNKQCDYDLRDFTPIEATPSEAFATEIYQGSIRGENDYVIRLSPKSFSIPLTDVGLMNGVDLGMIPDDIRAELFCELASGYRPDPTGKYPMSPEDYIAKIIHRTKSLDDISQLTGIRKEKLDFLDLNDSSTRIANQIYNIISIDNVIEQYSLSFNLLVRLKEKNILSPISVLGGAKEWLYSNNDIHSILERINTLCVDIFVDNESCLIVNSSDPYVDESNFYCFVIEQLITGNIRLSQRTDTFGFFVFSWKEYESVISAGLNNYFNFIFVEEAARLLGVTKNDLLSFSSAGKISFSRGQFVSGEERIYFSHLDIQNFKKSLIPSINDKSIYIDPKILMRDLDEDRESEVLTNKIIEGRSRYMYEAATLDHPNKIVRITIATGIHEIGIFIDGKFVVDQDQ